MAFSSWQTNQWQFYAWIKQESDSENIWVTCNCCKPNLLERIEK